MPNLIKNSWTVSNIRHVGRGGAAAPPDFGRSEGITTCPPRFFDFAKCLNMDDPLFSYLNLELFFQTFKDVSISHSKAMDFVMTVIT